MVRVALVVAFALVLAGCGGSRQATQGEPAAQTDCSLPWTSMDQVFDYASPHYEVASMEGEQTVNIIVATKDTATIAAAPAHAWNEHIPYYEEAVVWAWSDPAQIGLGYDRGVLSEQGQLGELLVFQICTSWTDYGAEIGETCGDRLEFTIEQ